MAYIGKSPAVAALTASDITDGIVSNAKLAQDIISADTALAVTPATTDELLLSDAGTLKRIDYSVIAGVTEADMWRLTANLTSSADPITSNLERVDDASFEKIGTGMTVSSGVWTFPSTGLWSVIMNIEGETSGSGQDTTMSITINNSAYDEVGVANAYGTDNDATSNVLETYANVTDVANVKVKFKTVLASGSLLKGDTARNETIFKFIRLGASQ